MADNCLPLQPTIGMDGNWKVEGAGCTHPYPSHPINYDCLHHGTPENCTNYLVPDPAQNKDMI